MKKSILAACAGLLATHAYAADWSGPHVGAAGAYGFGDAKTNVSSSQGTNNLLPAVFGPAQASLSPSSWTSHPNGALIGGQAGYDWQRGSMVYGVEADVMAGAISGNTSASNTVVAPGFAGFPMSYTVGVTDKISALGTLRGRIGWATASNWLVYGTGGLAWGNTQSTVTGNGQFGGGAGVNINQSNNPATSSATRVGWTLGAGAEYAINNKWSLRGEVLYYDLGKSNNNYSIISTAGVAPGAATTTSITASTKWTGELIRFGINYRF